MADDLFYRIIIFIIFTIGFAMLFLIFITNKLKNNIKNSIILFILFLSGTSLMVTKENYKPDIVDYFLIISLGISVVLNVIKKLYINDKNEEIFEEERKWKRETFGK